MKSALNHDLRTARRAGLLNLVQNFFVAEQVRAALIFFSEERAELALVLANVRVIYISVDDESHHVAEFFPAYGISRLAEFKQVAALEKFQRLVARQSQIVSPRFNFLPLFYQLKITRRKPLLTK